MGDGATVYSYVLLATIYGLLLVSTVHAVWKRKVLLATLAARRTAFYRNGIVNMAILAVLAVLAVVLHPDLTMAGAGWRWPDGVGTGYFYTGGILVLLVALLIKTRRHPQPAESMALLPRTRAERWLAGGAAFAFGIGEEIIYRGVLVAAGTGILGLPTMLVAGAGLVVFTAGHAYQGWRGMLSIGLLGYLLTMLYLSSASLLLPILMHIVWDLAALLLVRPPAASPLPDDQPASSGESAAVPPVLEEAAPAGTTAGTAAGGESPIRLRSPIPR